jgi:hypothetical protein
MYSRELVMVQRIFLIRQLSASEPEPGEVVFRKAMLLAGGGRLGILRIWLRWIGLA